VTGAAGAPGEHRGGGVRAGLVVDRTVWHTMVAHCLRAHPLEGCGLLAGDPHGLVVSRCFPTTNAAASARLYTVDPREHLRADRAAEEAGLAIVGVFHSHTHTDAFPSATDIAQAPDPTWHYVLVSLRDVQPVVRSYRIVDGVVTEEPLVVVPEVVSAAPGPTIGAPPALRTGTTAASAAG
jgi:proteasome lid subunit RPN8/RPN11